jgi:hypothetical protein
VLEMIQYLVFVGRILELFHDLVINTTGATNFMCNAL